MPRAANEIAQGRFNDLLRRFFGVVSPSPSQDIGSQLLPVFAVNDFLDITLPYLRTERLCSGGTGLTAVAGQYGYHVLTNPTGSGILLRLTRAVLSVGSATGFYVLQAADGAIAGLTPTTRRGCADTRFVNRSGVATLSTGSSATAPTSIVPGLNTRGAMASQANLPVDVPGSAMVLLPGWVCAVGLDTVNISSWATFEWLERRLTDEEATLV
jgi:hypothetical protein